MDGYSPSYVEGGKEYPEEEDADSDEQNHHSRRHHQRRRRGSDLSADSGGDRNGRDVVDRGGGSHPHHPPPIMSAFESDQRAFLSDLLAQGARSVQVNCYRTVLCYFCCVGIYYLLPIYYCSLHHNLIVF